MIPEEISIQVDEEEYIWLYDPSERSPQDCWSWVNARTHMTPATGMIQRLNREFFNRAVKDCESCNSDNRSRLCEILKAMGATDADFERFGVADEFYSQHPERTHRRFALNLPQPAHGPFNCKVIQMWFFRSLVESVGAPVVKTLANWGEINLIGDGPFDADHLAEFIRIYNVECYTDIDEVCSDVLILGRESWEPEVIDTLIDAKVGDRLYIYSQEMFLAFLACSQDPLTAPRDVLDAYRAGHPGLEFVAEGWPGWVDTYVPPNRRSSSRRTEFCGNDQSPLVILGYRAGSSGETESIRRRILRQAFTEPLPFANPADHAYVAQWGTPNSGDRLRRIAEHLAWLCRERSSWANPPEAAIADWESDLEWLRETFYEHSHFQFSWPNTFV